MASAKPFNSPRVSKNSERMALHLRQTGMAGAPPRTERGPPRLGRLLGDPGAPPRPRAARTPGGEGSPTLHRLSHRSRDSGCWQTLRIHTEPSLPPPLPAALGARRPPSPRHGPGLLGGPSLRRFPASRRAHPGRRTHPLAQVGTNLTDIVAERKITIRELGGCMAPIWSSYYGDCHSLLFMVDASSPTQLSASCVQLLGLLSAEQLAEASVMILFNKTDLPCYMTVEEMKSLIRLPDIIACAKQNITTAEISARKGTGLSEVLRWLQDTHKTKS